MRVCLNRLSSALPAAIEAFAQAGLAVSGAAFVEPCAVPVAPDVMARALASCEVVIVTSPEAATRLTRLLTEDPARWPAIDLYAVGQSTRERLPAHRDVTVPERPGAGPVAALLQQRYGLGTRCLVIGGDASGQQFQRLVDAGMQVDWLALYRLSPVPEPAVGDCLSATHWVHGSAQLLCAFLLWARQTGYDVTQAIHVVPSETAQSHLPMGCRYYRSETPGPADVLAALQGEPRVTATTTE